MVSGVSDVLEVFKTFVDVLSGAVALGCSKLRQLDIPWYPAFAFGIQRSRFLGANRGIGKHQHVCCKVILCVLPLCGSDVYS